MWCWRRAAGKRSAGIAARRRRWRRSKRGYEGLFPSPIGRGQGEGECQVRTPLVFALSPTLSRREREKQDHPLPMGGGVNHHLTDLDQRRNFASMLAFEIASITKETCR